jgi:hypothetical protein
MRLSNHTNFLLGILKLAACSVWLLTGCAPTVRLDTPEPIKVDINMKVDVYQKEVAGGTRRRTMTDEEFSALKRHYNRGSEIWGIKNDGAAVEGPNGYLDARPRSGWDPKYVNRLVTEENRDRNLLYSSEARTSARPLAVIEQEAGKRLQDEAYGGAKTNHVDAVVGPAETTTNQVNTAAPPPQKK